MENGFTDKQKSVIREWIESINRDAKNSGGCISSIDIERAITYMEKELNDQSLADKVWKHFLDRATGGFVGQKALGYALISRDDLAKALKAAGVDGPPKKQSCAHCGDKINANLFVKYFTFCPYCGRQLLAIT